MACVAKAGIQRQVRLRSREDDPCSPDIDLHDEEDVREKVRVELIGGGFASDLHAEALQEVCEASIVARVVSSLRKGETVEVWRLAPEDACSSDMRVLIQWHGRNVAIPLCQLTPFDADESAAGAIADWHYWVAQGYRF